ncbi:MAG: substrate-binding domain-containing protein [Chitinophagaceae bacterium]
MQELLSRKPRPTAILTINDWVALDAIQYAKSTGYRINEDLYFVSYANLPITDFIEHPPMASVEQYPYEQGAKAVGVLMQLFGGGPEQPYQNIEIEGRLIVHEKDLAPYKKGRYNKKRNLSTAQSHR